MVERFGMVVKMRHWGYKVEENDVAYDIKDEFMELLQKGVDCATATQMIIESNLDVIADKYDASCFWLVLAEIQWKYGILLDEVKKKALYYIGEESSIEPWTTGTPRMLQKRREVLAELKEKLLSPMPSRKKIRSPRRYRCPWNIGDVYAYRMESELAKEKGLYGRYILLRKVDEVTWHPGHIIPVVHVKITVDDALPTSSEEYEKLEYIQVSYFSKELFEMSVEHKYKTNPQYDEFGLLPQYQVQMITTTKRMLPKNLIFAGNFREVTPPKNEFVPHYSCSTKSVFWKELESIVARCYFMYNLRQAEVYQRIGK